MDVYGYILSKMNVLISFEDYLYYFLNLLFHYGFVLVAQAVFAVEFLHGLCYHRNKVDHGAEVRKIIFRHKVSFFDCSHQTQFMTIHEGFCHSRRVLAEHVTLYSVTNKMAVFVEMPEPISNYSSDRVPFIWMKLYKDSINIITMPISELHKVAAFLGNPKQKLILLSHPGRAGTTLFASMISKISAEVYSVSSHHSFYCLHNLKRILNPDQYLHLAQSVLRVTLKPIKGKSVIFIKGPFKTIDISQDIVNLFPGTIHLFMNRTPKEVIESHERAFSQNIDNKLLYLRMLINHLFGKVIFNLFHLHRNVQQCSTLLMPTQFEYFALHWASVMLHYKEMSEIIPTTVFTYEEIVNNPQKSMERFATMAQLKEPNIEQTLMALCHDSQIQTPYSQQKIDKSANGQIDESMKERLDVFCQILQLRPII